MNSRGAKVVGGGCGFSVLVLARLLVTADHVLLDIRVP